MQNKDISKNSTNGKNDFFSSFKNLEHKVEDIFQHMWHKPTEEEQTPDLYSYSTLFNTPRLDVIDKDKVIVVKAELPGMDKKDLDISISSNQLVIKGKTCHEVKKEDGDYLKQEISKSEIYRAVLLPADVDEDKVETTFKNGILELTIPKQKNSQRKKIELE